MFLGNPVVYQNLEGGYAICFKASVAAHPDRHKSVLTLSRMLVMGHYFPQPDLYRKSLGVFLPANPNTLAT